MNSKNNIKAFSIEEYERKTRMPREELIEIKQAFDIFDQSGDGTIDPQELRQAFEELGWKGNSKFIYKILEEIDNDYSGGIGFDEFLQIATSKVTDKNSKKETDKVFRMFDCNESNRNGKGFITIDDLRRIAEDLGEEMTEEELQDMFNRADADQDGKVIDIDIYNIMTGKFYWDK
ncbi:EF-hand protein (macronuclear) [Tetrahymena thermophila SB210]|uniref:EF-hand protein n=1 Tax=Tetrahymena thermophila (strain SB210) TaxID=312017 RepID=I7M058_TETTS|nr:EF-hand protein [Tetrahymena thermophila SB210]EAR85531.1 EF-hand protein [Tetrahymena thermophila SB210]|eukprot:XP_001033194.1 EF-hand protein [Tetrahymena thermophila SB210]